jgi:hypothetical protein
MHQYKEILYQCWLTMVAIRRNMGAMWILLFLEVWVVCFICWTPQYQIARNLMSGMVNLDQDYFLCILVNLLAMPSRLGINRMKCFLTFILSSILYDHYVFFCV